MQPPCTGRRCKVGGGAADPSAARGVGHAQPEVALEVGGDRGTPVAPPPRGFGPHTRYRAGHASASSPWAKARIRSSMGQPCCGRGYPAPRGCPFAGRGEARAGSAAPGGRRAPAPGSAHGPARRPCRSSGAPRPPSSCPWAWPAWSHRCRGTGSREAPRDGPPGGGASGVDGLARLGPTARPGYRSEPATPAPPQPPPKARAGK